MANLFTALDPIVSRVRQDISWKKTKKGETVCERDVAVSADRILEHLNNKVPLGVCPIKEGETTCRVALLDLDSHKGETPWEEMQTRTQDVCEKFEKMGAKPHPFRSSGGKGVHIYFLWDEPQDCYSVREFLKTGIGELGYRNGTKGVKDGEIEVFPKQNMVPKGGCGNQFILPLTGASVPLDAALVYEPVTREDASSMLWEVTGAVPVLERKKAAPTIRRTRYDGELATLKTALDKMDPDGGYDNWLRVGMALHLESGGSQEGLDLWDEWSSAGFTYQGSEETAYKWDTFKSDKETVVTAGFIKQHAENSGWTDASSDDFADVSDTPGAPPEPKERDRPDRFDFIRAADFTKRKPVEWLIKGIRPKGANMTYGGSGDGKTFVVLDLAFHIALGLDWNGRRTTRGRVLYICAEGAGGFTSRLRAFAMHHKIDLDKEIDDWLLVMPDTPNFLTDADIKKIIAKFKAFGKPIDMVVVDTFAQVTAGADENSGKEMSAAFRNIENLCRKLQSTYELIHHAGKDETRGARGWSGMKAPLDSQTHVYRAGDKRFFWIDKMKDGKDGFGFEFALRTIVVGMDEDGDPIESCYVEWLTGTSEKKTKESRFGVWEDRVLKAWDVLGGGNVSVDALLDEVKNSVPQDNEKKDRRRERAQRGLQNLADKGELVIRNNIVLNDLIAE